jgi:hypothetical protein
MNPDSSTCGRDRLWLVAFHGFILVLTGAIAYLFWGFSEVQEHTVSRHFGNLPVPVITQYVFSYRIAFLLVPLPWVVFAVWSICRGVVAPRQLIAFSSTLGFTLLLVAVFSAMAFTLPWFPPSYRSGNASLFLNSEQLAQALVASERDDAEANFRLFLHYAFTTHQDDLSERYLDKAAKLGSSRAQEFVRSRRSYERNAVTQ